MKCIFCEIAAGARPADRVYEDDQAVAFRDINPMAPVHILVIPREHITGPQAIDGDNADVAGHLIAVSTRIARELGIAADGYRLVLNEGRQGGQSVYHMHLHLLGGRPMGWPPG